MATPPLSVLIVDDCRDGADSLALLLKICGHTVSVAYDGATAIDMVREAFPDVVVADIGMPKMDGYQLLKQLDGLMPRKPLLIAMTGFATEKDRQLCLEAGFDHFLVKPSDPDELLDMLRAHAGTRAGRD